MKTDFGETNPSPRTITIACDPSEDELCACAQACNVDRAMIETVSPAHPEQQRRMECHLERGSYMETMSFEFYQKPDQEQKRFLMTAFEAVRYKNCLLRTRLVKYKGQVLQVVLSDKADWIEGADLSAYKKQDRSFRMEYGKPLFRYAWLEDEGKPTHFVWTVNYSCLFFWMRNLVLDDLHMACGDFAYFTRPLQDLLPLESYNVYWAGDLPRRQDRTFKTIDGKASRFNYLDYKAVNSREAYEVLYLQAQTPYSDTELSVVAHAAWALACQQDRRTPELELISVYPASHGRLQGFQDIMIPIAKGVQVSVLMERSWKIRELLNYLRNAHNCITGKEHGATKAPNALLFRGDFQRDPVGAGCLDRTFALFKPGVALALFRCVGAESIPPSHDYGLLLDIQKVNGFIEIQCTWDTIMGKAQVDQVFERFTYFFEAIVNGRGETVGDLLAGQWFGVAPRSVSSLCGTLGGNFR